MHLAFERFGRTGDDLQSGLRIQGQFSDSGFPEDLRVWIAEAELAHLIEEAVHKISSADATFPSTPARDLLLGILTYFYLTGVFLSQEIEAALSKSASIGQMHEDLFGKAEPSAVFRRFRRVNREAIERCLADVLETACSKAKDGFSGCLQGDSSEFKREASLRLTRAIQSDCWAMDL